MVRSFVDYRRGLDLKFVELEVFSKQEVTESDSSFQKSLSGLEKYHPLVFGKFVIV